MAFEKDIQKTINQAAHSVAQQQYAAYRNTLMTKVKEMAMARKTRGEITTYLAKVMITGKVE